MSYSKCGLCLKDLEVIKRASGIPYIRCVDWKLCPFCCHKDDIHAYQQCIRERVIPEYISFEGGQLPYCRHMDVATLRISRSEKNPFRPYFTCRRRNEMCRFFQWADEQPVNDETQKLSPLYCPEEKSHRKRINLHTHQDPSCKDNLPFQKSGLIEHSMFC